jgi:hypothetical protein
MGIFNCRGLPPQPPRQEPEGSGIAGIEAFQLRGGCIEQIDTAVGPNATLPGGLSPPKLPLGSVSERCVSGAGAAPAIARGQVLQFGGTTDAS